MTVRWSPHSGEDAKPSFSKIKTEWSKCKRLESSCWQWSSDSLRQRSRSRQNSSFIFQHPSLTGQQQQTLDPGSGCLCMGRIVWLAVQPSTPRFSGWDDFACVQSRCSGNWIGRSFKKRKRWQIWQHWENTPNLSLAYPSGTSVCWVSGSLSQLYYLGVLVGQGDKIGCPLCAGGQGMPKTECVHPGNYWVASAAAVTILCPKYSGDTGTPLGLPVCSSWDPFKQSRTPFGIIDLKEGQGECSRNHVTAWWKANFSWYDCLLTFILKMASGIGAGFQAFVSWGGEVAVNNIFSIDDHLYVEDKVSRDLQHGEESSSFEKNSWTIKAFCWTLCCNNVPDLFWEKSVLLTSKDFFYTCMKCLGRIKYIKQLCVMIFFWTIKHYLILLV